MEENIWIYKKGSNRRMEKVVLRRIFGTKAERERERE
jgi:hypothetical protein